MKRFLSLVLCVMLFLTNNIAYAADSSQHSFEGRTCTICGYKKPLSEGYVDLSGEISVSSDDEELKSSTENTAEESKGECQHSFEGRTCTICGYKKPLSEGNVDLSGEIPVPSDDEELKSSTENTAEESKGECQHSFEGRTCTICGYKKPLSEGNVDLSGEISSPRDEWEYVDDGEPASPAEPPECSHKKSTRYYDEWVTEKTYDEDVCQIETQNIYTLCDECGERLGNSQEVKYICHEFNKGICENCGYNDPNYVEEHIHEKDVETDTIYEEYDEFEHICYYTTVKYCVECGEELSNKTTHSKEKHYFNDFGSCSCCGYEKEICTHEKKSKRYLDSREPEYYDETNHIIEYTFEIYCRNCGEYLYTETNEEYIEHVIRAGVCTICGEEIYANSEQDGFNSRDEHTFDDEFISDDGYNSDEEFENCYEIESDDESKTSDKKLPQAETIVLHINDNSGYYDGKEISWNVTPKLVQNKTMVPLKQVMQLVGGEFIGWDEENKAATFYVNGKYVTYTNGKRAVEGGNRLMENPAQIVNGTMYVEVSSIASEAGYQTSFYDNYCVIAQYGLGKETVHGYATEYYDADFSYKAQVTQVDKTEAESRIEELNYIISAVEGTANNILSKEQKRKIIKNAENNIREYEEVIEGERELNSVSERETKYKAKTGSKSIVVEDLQTQLLELGYTSQEVTGRYDLITFNNVLYFQITNGLEPSGWLDVETVRQLNVKSDKTSKKYALTAEIEYCTHDRDGNLYVHILANEFTEQLIVSVANDEFEECVTVNDCEAWITVNVPSTGSYEVKATAKAQNYADYVVSKNVDVVVLNIIEKVFEDYAEEIEIGYEIQAGILYALTENLVLEPCVSIADSVDWIINYPDVGGITQRSEKRQNHIQSIENEIVKALPYGANYFYGGQLVGEFASLEVGAVMVVDGVNATITGIKGISNGLTMVNAQVLNATTGGLETVVVVVDSAALSTVASGIGSTAVGMSVISGTPKGEWENVDESDEFVDEKPNSTTLGKNMEKAGRYKPKEYKVAAHHIVAGGSKNAVEARAILKKFKIGINHEANGIFLPTTKNVMNSTYHPSMHTVPYYNKVTAALRRAKSREHAISILRDIAEMLADGTY